MKKIVIFLICYLLLTGCGVDNWEDDPRVKREREESAQQSKEIEEMLSRGSAELEAAEERVREAHEKEQAINGFLYATCNYEKYNSYASENGLDGTLVYVDGKVLNQTLIGTESELPLLAIVIEQEDGNRWCVSIFSKNKIEEIQDENVRAFGTYQGFSDVMNLPSIGVVDDDMKAELQAKNESGNYETIWSFNEYVWMSTHTETEEVNPYFSYKGNGDDVVTGVMVDTTSCAHIKNSGTGHFAVKGYYGNERELLVNTTKAYDGEVLLAGGYEYDFEVNAKGEWMIEICEQASTTAKSFSGNSDFVTPVFFKTDNVYEVTTVGDGHFSVKGWSLGGYDLLVNTTEKDYSGKIMFNTDEPLAFFEIDAEREWSIKPAE